MSWTLAGSGEDMVGLSFVLRRGDRIAFSLFCVFSVKKKKKSVFFGKTAKNTKLCKMTKITAFY
jgi:hypothetical protein